MGGGRGSDLGGRALASAWPRYLYSTSRCSCCISKIKKGSVCVTVRPRGQSGDLLAGEDGHRGAMQGQGQCQSLAGAA